jgi:hypothetical protein
LQTKVDGRTASDGQVAEVPLQVSATSQGPADARHSVPLGSTFSLQVLDVPLQVSSASQPVFSVAHTNPAGRFPSAGQAADDPVQLSATSHPPAASARHSSELEANPSAGQVADDPVQVSSTSQTPAEIRQTVVLGLNEQLKSVPDPVHSSQSPVHAA